MVEISAKHLREVDYAKNGVGEPWNEGPPQDLCLIVCPVLVRQGPYEVRLVQLIELASLQDRDKVQKALPTSQQPADVHHLYANLSSHKFLAAEYADELLIWQTFERQTLDLLLVQCRYFGPESYDWCVVGHVQALNHARSLRLHQTRLDAFDQVWRLLLQYLIHTSLVVDEVLEHGVAHHGVGERSEAIVVHQVERGLAKLVCNERHEELHRLVRAHDLFVYKRLGSFEDALELTGCHALIIHIRVLGDQVHQCFLLGVDAEGELQFALVVELFEIGLVESYLLGQKPVKSPESKPRHEVILRPLHMRDHIELAELSFMRSILQVEPVPVRCPELAISLHQVLEERWEPFGGQQMALDVEQFLDSHLAQVPCFSLTWH